MFHRMILGALFASTMLGSSLEQSNAIEPEPETAKVAYRTTKIDGIDIFYREAGPKDAPTVLLLHGFPSSSHMFRNLIPLLADNTKSRG